VERCGPARKVQEADLLIAGVVANARKKGAKYRLMADVVNLT